MFILSAPSPTAAKPERYAELLPVLRGLLTGERDPVANTANAAAFFYHALPGLNWAGFYFLRGAELVLGPFQGQPACVRIALDRGVCGLAARERRSVVVPDVRRFPGHIACDAASRAELVVPLLLPANGRLAGVIDLDSPTPGRFDQDDQAGVEAFAAALVAATDF